MAPGCTADAVLTWQKDGQTTFSTLRKTHLFIFENKNFYLFPPCMFCLLALCSLCLSISALPPYCEPTGWHLIMCPSSWAAVLNPAHTLTHSTALLTNSLSIDRHSVILESRLPDSHKHGSNSSRANSTLTTVLWLNICWTSAIAASYGSSILLHLFLVESDLSHSFFKLQAARIIIYDFS